MFCSTYPEEEWIIRLTLPLSIFLRVKYFYSGNNLNDKTSLFRIKTKAINCSDVFIINQEATKHAATSFNF